MDDKQPHYKPLSLMFVEYKSGDLLGFCLAWSSMIPIFLVISLATLIAIRRDLTTIFYLLGAFMNEAINFVLKNLIKQPRPFSNHDRKKGSFSKHGMPSDHSQMMFFFSTFFILLIAFRHYVHNTKFNLIAYKSLLIAGSFIAACVVAYGRVYLEYHTIEQVGVGAIIGISFGGLWFYAVNNIFSNYFHLITTWKISEFFMIRDYTHIPNILLFQYTAERNEANIRRKNKVN